MWSIAFSTFRSLDATNPSRIPPFPTVFTLRNTRIHVSAPYHSDNTSNIESPVDYFLSVIVILIVPYVDPDNGYIWFRRNLDNSWFRCKDDVIENIRVFKNLLNVFWRNVSVQLVNVVWNSYNFEVRLWLRKSRSSVMGHWNTNNFIFLFFYFSDFILIFFSFSFERWRGTWHHSHMTSHMMWHHKPRT